MNFYQASNPYEPTLANTAQRMRVWVRGVLRMHRKVLLVTLAAGSTLFAGVAASEAPIKPLQMATR